MQRKPRTRPATAQDITPEIGWGVAFSDLNRPRTVRSLCWYARPRGWLFDALRPGRTPTVAPSWTEERLAILSKLLTRRGLTFVSPLWRDGPYVRAKVAVPQASRRVRKSRTS